MEEDWRKWTFTGWKKRKKIRFTRNSKRGRRKNKRLCCYGRQWKMHFMKEGSTGSFGCNNQ